MTFEVGSKYENLTTRARRNNYELAFGLYREFADWWWRLEYRAVDRTSQGY
jgi:hypothetical protein